MIILGDRILVSRIEEEKPKEGFQTVEVQDSFLYKGKVEQVGDESKWHEATEGTYPKTYEVTKGDIVLFAKYSPHTQTVNIDDKDMKIIRTEDVIAVE